MLIFEGKHRKENDIPDKGNQWYQRGWRKAKGTGKKRKYTCISPLVFLNIILFQEVVFNISFKVLSLHHLEVLFFIIFFGGCSDLMYIWSHYIDLLPCLKVIYAFR